MYKIAEDYIGGSSIESSKEEFSKLEQAKVHLDLLWKLEINFSIFAKAYLEFEKCLDDINLKSEFEDGLYTNPDQVFYAAHEKINLRTVTFLVAARIYEEKALQLNERFLKYRNIDFLVSESHSESFDSSFEYRVIQALRNFAVHEDLPIASISFGASNLRENEADPRESPSRLRSTVDPKISIDKLIESKKIRKKTKNELSDISEEFLDLKFFIRGFVEELTKCHFTLREHYSEVAEGLVSKFDEVKSKLQKSVGREVRHVVAIRYYKNRKAQDVYIDPEFNKRVLNAKKRWMGLKNVQRTYLSSEVIAHKNKFPQVHDRILIEK
ncbi:MAG: hypothetical protein AAF429_12990 [Pseudomonadota bacterium]